MMLGERQVGLRMEQIKPDHRARYIFASRYLKHGDRVLDACCGIGYGSKLMAQLSTANIMAFDKDKQAIVLANKYYDSPSICFINSDFKDLLFPKESFDAITLFESIEHINEPIILLRLLYQVLSPNGLFFVSTPNETLMPYSKERFPEHLKHYVAYEFADLIESAGFKIDSWHCQRDKYLFDIHEGHEGNFMIAVCHK